MASIAISLYPDYKNKFIDRILAAVLDACDDRESKVQLAACDALYNLVKFYQDVILSN